MLTKYKMTNPILIQIYSQMIERFLPTLETDVTYYHDQDKQFFYINDSFIKGPAICLAKEINYQTDINFLFDVEMGFMSKNTGKRELEKLLNTTGIFLKD